MRAKWSPALTTFWSLVAYLVATNCLYSCQFISHFNAKGLRGNITFNIEEVANASVLVIESTIETDETTNSFVNPKDESKLGADQLIIFEWSLHYNTLDPRMLITCSNDDLSSEVPVKSSENRSISLNKFNRWTTPLDEFLQANSVVSLSALFWGRSIRLKLSSIYNEKTSDQSVPASRTGIKPAGSVIAVSKPRPKPTITAKLKVPGAPALPKPEALVLETNVTSSDDPKNSTVATNSKDIDSQQAAHKRITQFYGRTIICGNIVDSRTVKTAEAIFESQIAGKVTMRGNEDEATLIMLNLYHVKSKVTTRHDWKILASDILDNHRHDEQCKYLQTLFDPNNLDDSKCKRNETSNCKLGDLTNKHGQVQIAGQGKETRTTLLDLNLPLSSLEGSRSLFLVIYDSKIGNNGPTQRPTILSCTQIRSIKARKVEANFNMDGVRGSIKISQRHPTEPASISYDLFGLEGNIKHLSIRELPLMPRTSSDNGKLCNSLGDVFNPYKQSNSATSDKPSTIDSYPIGNLTAKHGQLSVIDSEYEDHYMGDFLDLSIQLYGPHMITGRSIVIHKNNGENWVCANIEYSEESVSMAAATFHYPVVGRITFQQLAEDPHAETGVTVEVYNPNNVKDSDGHNWMIHLKPAMADFYNWSQRCESCGEIYDPLQASQGLAGDGYNKQCQASMLNLPLRCRAGDTGPKSGFKLFLPVSHLNKSRLYYTDLFLPLSKSNSIVGKSVVIYDEHAPTQRGNRLACSTIKMVHPLKAAIRSWNSGPSIPSNVVGSVLFEQETSNRLTRIKIDLNGFNGNVENYAIHNVWTMDDREFPCSNDSLYDIYDPYDNENSLRLPPSAHYGSLATVDRVKVGDMSRKHGTFEGLQSVQRSVVDANLPLFAPRSIIGRSMVLRAAVNDFRWVCGNIELDYDKVQSREIVGIASFDEPRSKIAGYVRFIQLEHKDSSLSDTYIQIDLKMQADGVHELQTSESHNWAIFVNQVGEDAFITADDVRCIAAGFKWNPYLAQDSLETYPGSCNPSEQLACAMGDLGMRHGLLTLGPNNRRTVSDSNLPLVGNYSVMGRSLIIFDSKRPNVKLACANIFPDMHLRSNVVIKRTPSFTVARFVEQMRTLLGAPEWLMVPELRATKSVANGECVQMTIHFYGRKAHQMQSELNNLISLGTVRKSTPVGVDKISTHYKLCRTGQTEPKSSATSLVSGHYLSSSFIRLISLFTAITRLTQRVI